MDDSGLRELPLQDINALFYLPKKGLDFEECNFVMRELENYGADVDVTTHPYGLVENNLLSIVCDVSLFDVDVTEFDCLVVSSSSVENKDSELEKQLKSLIEQFHSHSKVVVFLGSTRALLFEMGLIDASDALDLGNGGFRAGNIFYFKEGDMEEFSESIAEFLSDYNSRISAVS